MTYGRQANAGVVEQVDTRDLKSLAPKGACRFESGLRQLFLTLPPDRFIGTFRSSK